MLSGAFSDLKHAQVVSLNEADTSHGNKLLLGLNIYSAIFNTAQSTRLQSKLIRTYK